LQPVGRNTVPSLELPIAGRKRIVEDCIVGEVAHGEAVNLANRTRVARSRSIYTFNREAARKHGFTLNDARRIPSSRRSAHRIGASIR
jgi:hypothetical protein